MKKPINPAVSVVIVIVVVGVAVMLGWKSLGPRTDGPKEPMDMGKMMGQKGPPSTTNGQDMSKMMGKMAPPSTDGQGTPGGSPGGR